MASAPNESATQALREILKESDFEEEDLFTEEVKDEDFVGMEMKEEDLFMVEGKEDVYIDLDCNVDDLSSPQGSNDHQIDPGSSDVEPSVSSPSVNCTGRTEKKEKALINTSRSRASKGSTSSEGAHQDSLASNRERGRERPRKIAQGRRRAKLRPEQNDSPKHDPQTRLQERSERSRSRSGSRSSDHIASDDSNQDPQESGTKRRRAGERAEQCGVGMAENRPEQTAPPTLEPQIRSRKSCNGSKSRSSSNSCSEDSNLDPQKSVRKRRRVQVKAKQFGQEPAKNRPERTVPPTHEPQIRYQENFNRSRSRSSSSSSSSSSSTSSGTCSEYVNVSYREKQQEPQIRWQESRPYPPNTVEFTGNPGIKVETRGFSPSDYFGLFVNDDLISHIVTQTNLYATQFVEDNEDLPKYSRARDWADVSAYEMRQFLGFFMLTGIVKMPLLEHYWSNSILFKFPMASMIMLRNRFQIILRFLHFNDNSEIPDENSAVHDKLYKLRPVIDHLLKGFQAVYEPNKNVCVAESLLFRQNVGCTSPFEIKLHLLCESDGETYGSGGYCCRFHLSTGEEDQSKELGNILPVDARDFSIHEQTVVYLGLPLLHKGYTIYMKDSYSSVRLYLYLLEKKTLACGTVMETKGLPQELLDSRPAAKSTSVCLCGDGMVNATKYVRDLQVAYFLSTCHGHKEQIGPSRKRDGSLNLKRPRVFAEYNKNMTGASRLDQLIQPYDCVRKQLTWTKKVFFHLLQMSLCNAFILAKKDGYDKSLLNFMESVILSWLFKDSTPAPPAAFPDEIRCIGRHFPAPIPPTKKALPTRICVVCSKRGIKRKETRNHCPDCPSKPALCLPDCYRIYHTKMIYWK